MSNQSAFQVVSKHVLVIQEAGNRFVDLLKCVCATCSELSTVSLGSVFSTLYSS